MHLESTRTLVIAEKRLNPEGKPDAFLLRHDSEQIALEPGKSWAQLDTYKWVTRGIIDEPSGFHVLPNGAVQIHGEEIRLQQPDAAMRLERRINQHLSHEAAKPSRPLAQNGPRPDPEASTRVIFKVHLDRLGHLMVTAYRGAEKTETGIRGLDGLVRNGLMIRPGEVHVDPLLAWVEVDGNRFESNAASAQALEQYLNARYAPSIDPNEHNAIEIKANPAAPAGFDIHFFTSRAGARFEVKGHLSQAHLDALQDAAKCDLLRPGIILRLSPPHLIIRRRRPDGGEEHLPELADVNYLHSTAAEMQKVLNHPAIRRGGAAGEPAAPASKAPAGIPHLLELRLHRNPQNPVLLNLEIVSSADARTVAFTHYNIADLQHSGAFLPHLHASLSFDNRTLIVRGSETHKEEHILIEPTAPESLLQRVSCLLTKALKPPPETPLPQGPQSPLAEKPAPNAIPEPEPQPPGEPKPSAPATAAPQTARTFESVPEPPAAEAAPEPVPTDAESTPGVDDSPLRALFSEHNGLRINAEIFGRLEQCLGLPVQRIRLGLERVFENRLFEIISFTHPEVTGILDLHSDSFAGFYLSHINDQRIILDYAWHGKRIEWGPNKCWVRAGVKADSEEFNAPALLGMALLDGSHFVFIVTPEFKEWIAPREQTYADTGASFITVDDLAGAADQYPLVWPVPAAEAAPASAESAEISAT